MTKTLGFLSRLALKILIFTAALAIVASEMAFAIEDKEHWESTSISETDLKHFVNSKNCYKNENDFVGCVEAINSLLATSTPAKILSNKKIEDLPEMKEISKIVERVQIRNHAPVKLDNKNLADSWKASAKTRAIINRSWKDLYSVTKKKPVSFETLLESAIALADKSHFKSKLADAVNAFYRNAIDPHTYITPTAKWNETVATSEQSLVGAGVYIQKLDDQFLLKPMENGPASMSGIRNMDILEKIDGQETTRMALDQVVKLIRGTKDTPVVLTISRKGVSQEITVIRAAFVSKKIDSRLIVDPLTNKKIGLIKLSSFMAKDVCKKFVSLAIDLNQQGAENLILDLRDNGGGLLNEALCIASNYLEKGQVVLTENNPATNEVIATHRSNGSASIYKLYKNKPLFILQNASSASASEVLAGALATYGRAITIGERSYGKGTVQKSQESINDVFSGIMMMRTMSRFHFATGASNQIVGIQPDFLAYKTPNPSSNDQFAIREIDSYPNAILSAKPLNGFGAHAVKAIHRCIRARNLISTGFDASAQQIDSSDYQVLMAREVASCQLDK